MIHMKARTVTAMGSRWLYSSERPWTLMRKSLALRLHKVAKYEVHARATAAAPIMYSRMMLPAAMKATKSPSSTLR